MTVINEPRTARRRTRPRSKRRMSEQEFVSWAMARENIRAEWVDGEVIRMAPVSGEHTDLALWLLMLVKTFVDHRDLGLVRGTEFMVRFEQLRRRRVPDILFISKGRLSLVRPNHLEGAPDLIMEIVSPDSVSRDWREKFEEYQTVGVREYWVIDPNSQHVEAYVLRNKTYRRIEEKNAMLRSSVIKRFWIKPQWLWARPSVLAALRELGIKS